MTLPQRILHPTSGNERGTLLGALEFVACCSLQFAEVVGTVVGHGMAFEPSPKVFDRVHVGRVGRQECNLNVVPSIRPGIRVQTDCDAPSIHPRLPIEVASNGS